MHLVVGVYKFLHRAGTRQAGEGGVSTEREKELAQPCIIKHHVGICVSDHTLSEASQLQSNLPKMGSHVCIYRH
jgi:hypothetical protein